MDLITAIIGLLVGLLIILTAIETFGLLFKRNSADKAGNDAK